MIIENTLRKNQAAPREQTYALKEVW